MKNLLFCLFVFLGISQTFSKSFSTKNANGFTIYYQIVSEDEPFNVKVVRKNGFIKYNQNTVNIPATVTFEEVVYTVTRIGSEVFDSDWDLIEITLPNTIEIIEYRAFNNCSNLSRVLLGTESKLKIIEAEAFSRGSGYAKRNLDFSTTVLETIKVDAFTNSYTKSVILPNTLKTIEDRAFYGCTQLENITIPNSVTRLGSSTFRFCTSLTNIILSENLKVIKNNTFETCRELTAISLPKNLETIDYQAFKGTEFNSIIFPKSVKTISNNAFEANTDLNSVTVKSFTPISISASAFSSLNTSTLKVPLGSKSNYQNAEGWRNFGTITTEGTIFKKDNVYYNIFNESPLQVEIIKDPNNNINYAGVFTVKKEVTFDNVTYPITKIGNNAFKDNTNLIEIIIPNTITSIGENAFNGATSLTAIFYDKEIPLNINENTFSNLNLTNITLKVPLGTTSDYKNTAVWQNFINLVEDPFFENQKNQYRVINKNLQEVAITAKLDSSVYTDTKLQIDKEVTYKNITYKITTIDANTFENAINITEINLLNTLTSIGDSAFKGCTGLVKVFSEIHKPITINQNVFAGVNLSNVDLEVLTGSQNFYQQAAFWQDFKTVFAPNFFKEEGIYYNVLSTNPLSVEVIADPKEIDSYSGDITLEHEVTFNQITYFISKIAAYAFKDATQLKNVSFPSGFITILNEQLYLKDIGIGAFENCTNLKTINFPRGLKNIQPFTFKGCSELESLVLPFLITSAAAPTSFIGESAFEGCTNLATVKMPTSSAEISIQKKAFKSCSSLKSIDIGTKNIKTINESAFENCSSLTSIALPQVLTDIKTAVFKNCANLERINIPESITNIGENAFENCTKLNDVHVNNYSEVLSVANTSFRNINVSSSTLKVPLGFKNSYENASVWQNFGTILEDTIFIKGGLFYSVKNTNEVSIIPNPNNRSNIDENVRYSGSIMFNEVVTYNSVDYTLTEIAANAFEAVQFSNTNLILPNTVTNIGDTAFAYSNITSVVFPNNLITVENNAFYDCEELAGVFNFKEGLKTIGANAFSRYTSTYSSLKSIEISFPSSLTSIDRNAFRNLPIIRSISINKTVPINIHSNGSISGNLVFEGVPLNNVKLIVPPGAEEAYRNAPIWGNFGSIKGFSYTKDGIVYKILKENSTPAAEVVANSTAQYSGDITIPNEVILNGINYEVTRIDASAFYEATNLTNLVLPNTITSLGDAAFYKCTSLQSINLPEGINSIPDNAFSFCKSLAAIKIPETVINLGKFAFARCTSLTNITLPKAINSFGSSVFDGSTNLTEIKAFMEFPPTISATDYIFNYFDVPTSSSLSFRKDIDLTIPEGKTSNYTNAGWTGFKSVTEIDITAPTTISFSILDDARNVAVNSNLEINFNETIQLYTGTELPLPSFTIYNADDKVFETIALDSNLISISDKKVTINPTNNLEKGKSYYILIDANLFEDTANNYFVGISDKTSWNFSTEEKIAPTITFIDFSKSYGDDNFNLNATSNSTGIISYSILAGGTGTATLSGNHNSIISIGNIGTLKIKATISEDADYLPEEKISTLTINKKEITITPNVQEKIYGDKDPILTYSVLPNLHETDLLTGSLMRDIGENIGTYTINSNLTNSNYTINFTPAVLTIQPMNITINAVAKTKIYGEADPELRYSSDKALIGSDVLIGNITRTSGKNVGDYPITSTLNHSNYNITFNTANFTITPKLIAVIADVKTKIYGEENPEFTYTITPNLIENDILTGYLSKVDNENVGTYPLNSTLANPNYKINFSTTFFNIIPKEITVTANAGTKVYGDLEPILTYTVNPELVREDVLYGNLTRMSPNIDIENGEEFLDDASEPLSVNKENAGIYKIESQLYNQNYNITFITANFTIIKANQTITFEALLHTKDTFILMATASSGLDVSYQSSDASLATINQNSVTILNAGTITITALQIGNNNYNAAEAVRQILTVNTLSSFNEVIERGKIAIYPNPSTQNFKIHLGLENANVSIFDITGKKIKEFKHYTSNEVIDTSNLKIGVYLIRIRKNKSSVSKRFIKI